MTEPDELYTLRAQYWLGHYALAIEEAKSVLRRPMSPQLKLEREEFLLRAQLALGQYDRVIAGAQEGGDRPGTYIMVLVLRKDLRTAKVTCVGSWACFSSLTLHCLLFKCMIYGHNNNNNSLASF
jgi:Coatomer epsilon subunit